MKCSRNGTGSNYDTFFLLSWPASMSSCRQTPLCLRAHCQLDTFSWMPTGICLKLDPAASPKPSLPTLLPN